MNIAIPYRTVCIFGFACDPPHVAHRVIVDHLSSMFDEVYVIPSGSRGDKTYGASNEHRLAMLSLQFDDEWKERHPNVYFDTSHVELMENTPTIDLVRLYRIKGLNDMVYCAVGGDLIKPREDLDGRCEIEALWVEGKVLFNECPLAVFIRKGHEFTQEMIDAPNVVLIPNEIPDISSSEIRERVRLGKEYAYLVHPNVYQYMKDNKIYRNDNND